MYPLLKSQYKLLANFKCILFAFHFHLKTTNKTGVDRETRKDVARPAGWHIKVMKKQIKYLTSPRVELHWGDTSYLPK